MKKYKVILSDCHLSAGRLYEGRLNPHEDFFYDDEMVDLIHFFSSGVYHKEEGRDVEVEIILAGDFFDFLNVPLEGEFEDLITQEMSIKKLEAILSAHESVIKAFKTFASLPGKSLTVLVGNHDADLFWPKVAQILTQRLSPEGTYPCKKVQVLSRVDRLTYPEGFEIRHGNQLEAGSQLDFDRPFDQSYDGSLTLQIPWSSTYVLKIVNRLKWEREFLDKIRPVKVFTLLGLVLDPWFTLRFTFLSVFYFLKTRLAGTSRKRFNIKNTIGILKQETRIFLDLEAEAREVLDQRSDLKTIIMGHTHRPMNKIYPDGKQYINTGSWVKMIDLDWRNIGRQYQRTFCLVKIEGESARCELRQWVGEHSPHQIFYG